MGNFFELGIEDYKKKNFESAKQNFIKSIEVNPRDEKAYFKFGNAKRALGDIKGAIEDYDKAIELKKDYASAYYNRGNAKSDLDDIKGAIEDYDKAIELKKDYASAYYNRGNAKIALGDIKGAIEDYDKAIELKKDYASAYYNRGNAKIALGDIKGAIEDYDKAIELKKDDASAYYNRGNAKIALGDIKGAIEDYDKAIELKEDYEKAYYNRGNAKIALDDIKGAIEDYDKAIELKKDYASAYNNRGIAKRALGDIKGAIEDYDKAIELKKDYASAYNNRGNAKRALGDLKVEKKDDKEISIEDYKNAIIEYEKAIEDLKKAIEINKEKQLYKNNLKKTEETYEEYKFESELNPCEYIGYLVFADILGWKGIWQKKHFNPSDGLKTMLRIKRNILKIESEFTVKVNLISDTFVIFSDKLDIITKASKILIESCLNQNLVVRGAMSYGKHYNLGTVYVGPAVDEAASWHEKGEEVVILCTTSARLQVMEEYSDESGNKGELKKIGIVERNICTKQGKIESYVIDWYSKENEEQFMKIMKETQIYPELYQKYNNTEKALKEQLQKNDKNKTD